MVITINKAEYLADYKISFEFSDKVKRLVDFKPFLSSANNPMITKYLDLKEFRNFKLEKGDITWNDYELCFPVWDLHEGRI